MGHLSGLYLGGWVVTCPGYISGVGLHLSGLYLGNGSSPIRAVFGRCVVTCPCCRCWGMGRHLSGLYLGDGSSPVRDVFRRWVVTCSGCIWGRSHVRAVC